MSNPDTVLKKLKSENVKYVDLRFTDLRGKLQHVSIDASVVDRNMFANGVMFDGSSIAGWKAIHESDMKLVPDVNSAALDPFYAQTTLTLFCDVLEPTTNKAYDRDPRSIAGRAESHLRSTGIGDTAYFGPEAEFFVFDDVRFSTEPYQTGFELDGDELPVNSATEYDAGNLGHRPRTKGGYFPVNPVDSAQDLRSEIVTTLREMGVPMEKHHHEVGASQHELGLRFSTLTHVADRLQTYKYVTQNVAQSYGKTATFMPKPVFGDNGSGMHCHQSIWKGKKPLFRGDKYAGLSQECLYYIGGLIKHARAINAFANPSTNSYKRLVPGYEAPVLLVYSARNRSAACRIPLVPTPNARRIEVRFPDPLANPYLLFAAMLMAGLDGIQNKIDPGEPLDKDLYDLPPEELKGVPTVCRSLRDALDALDQDRAFLKQGGVMTDSMIDGYLGLKWEEVERFEQTPHPVEFDMYYSA